MTKLVATLVALISSCFTLVAQQTTTMSVDPATFQSLLLKSDGESVRITLPLPGIGMRVAELSRFRVADEATSCRVMTDNGPMDMPLPPSVHLRGSIQGFPHSFVVLSLFDTWSIGRVVLEPGTSQVYSISPENSRPNARLVIAPESMLERPAPWNCATDDDVVGGSVGNKGEITQDATIRTVKLALEGDYNYYQDLNNNATTATEYAQAVIAHSSSIYQRDVSATLYIGSILIWTVNDPYTGTSSNTLLTQFRDYWRINRTGVDRDVAQLLSGVNGIGGIAYLNTLCSNSNAYSVAGTNNNIVYPRTTYAWDTDVNSHELGHNIGSPHTHACSWAPPIDSCYTAEGTCFTTTHAVLGTIMSYCHLSNPGTELRFHTRVSDLLKEKLNAATCVEVSSEMTVSAGKDTMICSGSAMSLKGTMSGGTGPYVISWTPSAGLTNSNTLTPSGAPTTTTTYILQVRDAMNTVKLDTVVVVVNPKLTVDLPASTSFCTTSPLIISATVSGGTAPIVYRWTGFDIDTTTTSSTVALNPTASTLLRLSAVDSKGCSAKDSMQIAVYPAPELTLKSVDSVVCNGNEIVLSTTVMSGRSPYSFSWYANGVLLPSPNASITLTLDTATFILVVVRDANGCVDSASTYIEATHQQFSLTPKTVALPNLPACENEVELWVTVKNTGRDNIQITNVKAGHMTVSSRDLAFTLARGASHLLPILCMLPPGDVLDTIQVISAQCGRIESFILSGKRENIEVANGEVPAQALPILYCSGTQPRTISIDIANETNFDAQIQSVTSRWFKTTATSVAPKTLRRKTATSIDVVLDVAAPPGAVLDTLDVKYRSSGCESSFIAPIRIETAVGAVSMPNQLDFGVVSSDQTQYVIRDLSITPDINPLSSAMVTLVAITGPFTTSFAAPTLLQHNVVHTESVFFDPKSITESGVVHGELSFYLDSCSIPYKVALVATQTVVGVDDDKQQLAHGTTVIVRNGVGSVLVRGSAGHLVVCDVRGLSHYSANVTDGQTVDLQFVPNGLYAITLTQDDGSVHYCLLSLP